MSGGTAVAELDWLLENLAAAVDGVRYAVILSPDGLALGRSPEVTEEAAGHLAALAAGVQSLARGHRRASVAAKLARLSSRWTPCCCSSSRRAAAPA